MDTGSPVMGWTVEAQTLTILSCFWQSVTASQLCAGCRMGSLAEHTLLFLLAIGVVLALFL